MSGPEVPDHRRVLTERYDLAAVTQEQVLAPRLPPCDETPEQAQERHREDLLDVFPPARGRGPRRGR